MVITPVTGTMDSINTTDIAVASSPSANVSAVTLMYMCHLFGFMEEWLQGRGISTERTMIYDTVQKENIFSDGVCDQYLHYSRFFGECVDNSMEYNTDPEHLRQFGWCIMIHFATKMGAKDYCKDRYDVSGGDKDLMALLSRDILFYSFMVNTLNAGTICQARNDSVTFSPSRYNCDWFIYLRHYAGSKCTYDTPRIDSVRQFYSTCLPYHFLKSLGADSVCKDWTLVYMCSLFDAMRALLQGEGISTDRAIVSASNINAQRENLFSDAFCDSYHNIKPAADSICASNSMLYITDPKYLFRFTDCITHHFMTEMRARNSCSDDAGRSNINTPVKNTVPLLSNDRLFFSFIVDKLDAGNICKVKNAIDTATVPTDNCERYIFFVKKYHHGSRCVYNSQRIHIGRKVSYDECLYYRLMKSLGADSVCLVSLTEECDWYYDIVQSLVPTCICVFGLIGNLLSICMFGSGAVETPIAYQLQWLAGVDITFILTWWVVEVLPGILRYYNGRYNLTPYETSVMSVLTVYLKPLSHVARSCTVWLTVIIGLYRYLAVCKPHKSLTFHCTQHGHKYVILIAFLSFLYNIPYFCEYCIEYKYTAGHYIYENPSYYFDDYVDGWVGFYVLRRTSLVNKELLDIYSRLHAVVIVSLPCLIQLFVTASILVKLRRLQQKRRGMHTSQTSQNSITVMLVTILITFIICQLPYFVWSGFGGEIRNPDLDPFLDWLAEEKIQGCGTFMFYIRQLVDVGLLLNSSANGFIYFFLNKTFRKALVSRCPCRRGEETEMIEMGSLSTSCRKDDTHPAC